MSTDDVFKGEKLSTNLPEGTYTVGVLALQGSFQEHANIIKKLGHNVIKVKQPKQIPELDALVLPGGESTTMGTLLHKYHLVSPIMRHIEEDKPVLGTCAGMILLSKVVVSQNGPEEGVWPILEIVLERNWYGSQINSFTGVLTLECDEKTSLNNFKAVFIRAPKIVDLLNQDSLAKNANIVLIKQKNILATTFHPEVGSDSRLHQYFLSMIERKRSHTPPIRSIQ